MKFDVEKFLKDTGVEYQREEKIFKGSLCTCYQLSECAFDASHTNNDACIFQYENGSIAYKCFHNSCQDKKWKDAKAKLKERCKDDLKEYWSHFNIESKDKPSRQDITYISGTEVMANPKDIEWLIINMLSMNESILIHAKGGLGKSMFVLYLLLKLASPERSRLFDNFIVPERRCSLIIGAENGSIATYQRLKKMCDGPGNLKDGLGNIFFLSKYGDTTITGEVFLDESFCNFLVEFIKKIEAEKEVKIDILVIDPLISFSGAKNENDAAEMRPSLDAMDSVCRQARCTPIIIHHDKKDGGDYRGSTAINDWARNRIRLKQENVNQVQNNGDVDNGPKIMETDCIRIIHEKCNNFQMFHSFLVKMTDNLHFEKVSEQMSQADAEVVIAVSEALKDMGGHADSMNALADQYRELSGVGRTTARKHILMAVEKNLIRRDQGQNGRYRFDLISG